MKLTKIGDLKTEATFKTGDFFLNSEGHLRRVVNINGQFGILDVAKGTLAIVKTGKNAQEIVAHYVAFNDPVTKVKVEEITYISTVEVLLTGKSLN